MNRVLALLLAGCLVLIGIGCDEVFDHLRPPADPAASYRRSFKPVDKMTHEEIQRRVHAVQVDMRVMATALETYYLDHNAYPAWSLDPAANAIGGQAQATLKNQPTFQLRQVNPEQTNGLMTLTTPVAYLVGLIDDSFAFQPATTFSYWTVDNPKTPGWIIWSPGPDGKYELSMDNVARLYDPAAAQPPSPDLLARAYDPTNGLISGGDIWRIRQ